MHRSDNARPGRPPGASAAATSSCLVDGGNSIRTLRLRHLIRRVHRLGPRPISEILLEFAPDRDVLAARLERYAALDPDLVEAARASDWIDRRNLVRRVRP
jgi:hypothetical protein